jgi:competence protein ComEA
MIEFGKREAVAAAAVLGTAVVGGTGWAILQQRQQAVAADLKPIFSDGKAADTAGPDGTLEIPAAGPEESAPSSSPSASDAPPADKPDRIIVFVSGAVKRPGVYALKPGAKLYQAVHAAGGFKANAQQDALNQAENLQDADQIYIPPRSKASSSANVSVTSEQTRTLPPRADRSGAGSYRPVSLQPPSVTVRPLIIEGTKPSVSQGASLNASAATPRQRGRVLGKPAVEPVTIAAQSSEPAAIEGSAAEGTGGAAEDSALAEPVKSSGRSRGSGSGSGSKFKNPGDGVVNINTAGPAELQKLPGVGPSTAQKFIEYRTQIGRFASVEQVQDIKGIGPKKYAKLRPFISL